MTQASPHDSVRHVVLVERYFCDITPCALGQLAMETRAAATHLAGQGIAVTYLGSMAIPEEETCFCLFVAESHPAIERMNRRIAVPCVRVVRALTVDR